MEWPEPPSLITLVATLLAVTLTTTSGADTFIQAPWGALRGISVEGDGGRKMNAYMAIPYALPPVGDLRFEKPVPHPGPGEGVTFVADQIAPACPQNLALLGTSTKTSEDCLILNVFTPEDAHKDGPLAVMIFIHGGGFSVGDAHMTRPSKLVVDGRTIVAVIQYRLGPLGFLSTGDGTVPGNAGLWDQNLAIRWVRDNVQAFGGDPTRITIFGESAGSMSVALQMMSPQSKGLFQRGVMQSGAPGCVSFLSDVFDMKVVFKGLADMFECPGETTRERVKCLKEQTEETFMNKSLEYSTSSPASSYFFPLIDGEFIPRGPNELLQDEEYMKENGIDDIDLIVGLNNKEGGLVLFMTVMMNTSVEDLHASAVFHSMADACLLFKNLTNNSVVKKAIEYSYRGADYGSDTSATLDSLVDMYGDCLLTVDILDWSQRLASSSHKAARYVYVFDHDFAFNEGTAIPGSHHGDELILEFDSTVEFPEDFIFKKLNKTEIAPEELPLSDKFVQILASFAKTGNPNPPLKDDLGGGEWPRFSKEDEAYLSISLTPKVVTQLGPYKDRLVLWTKFLPDLSRLASKLPPEEKEEGVAKGQADGGSRGNDATREEL